MDLERIFDRSAGSTSVSRLAVSLTGRRLRILAYHGIDSQDHFARQMEWLHANLEPVGSWDVIRWTEGSRLPTRAVWITFDDGDPSVVTRGVPVLEAFGLPSTMFICPGVVDTAEPLWWQVAERAGLSPTEIGAFKRLPDEDRRERISALSARIGSSTGTPWQRQQLTTSDIKTYLAAGGTIGNHTWDHPCLDRCDEQAQVRQISEAHRWISAAFPGQPPVFAYPNGNHTSVAEAILEDTGYRVGLLFDHRLASRAQGPLALSRLRADADSGLERLRSVVSGLHPAVHRARLRATGAR